MNMESSCENDDSQTVMSFDDEQDDISSEASASLAATSRATIVTPSPGGVQKKGKKAQKVPTSTDASPAVLQIWEKKVELLEKSKNEYREVSRKLLSQNELLQAQLQKSEKDTVDVLSFLKRQDEQKQNQIEKLEGDSEGTRCQFQLRIERMEEKHVESAEELQTQLEKKTHELEMVHHQLKSVKDFQTHKDIMTREINILKDTLLHAKKLHRATLYKLERRFFEEKMKLQQEAGQKIADLSEQAHNRAVANLSETTKAVYKDNQRMTTVLSFHVKNSNAMRLQLEQLQSENRELQQDKELNEQIAHGKIEESKKQKDQIAKLQQQVESLKKTITVLSERYNTDRSVLLQEKHTETQSCQAEQAKLQQALQNKCHEVSKVRHLARSIIRQRSEMEEFFLDALEHVKNEITFTRQQYRKEVQTKYNKRMMAAYCGKGSYPPVRTFTKQKGSSNSVFSDLELGENWTGVDGKVDISDLTWEQKERVLRFLFSRMNSRSRGRRQQPLDATPGPRGKAHSISDQVAESTDHTFITQAKVDRTGHVLGQADIAQIIEPLGSL
ncbi:PREDICTED: basal body-orientation factor 1-like isoform X2 [Priapulus caudatus]|uniref:Basal body-orientation factor 1 n=1 Tax=Priapulus caudatus TaxID=37621 RepID=A0ABM1DVC1_PRICU|nr:PREDICTED: basal body-orientation factor 1-like isoform X2 [Priapulus caudatus]